MITYRRSRIFDDKLLTSWMLEFVGLENVLHCRDARDGQWDVYGTEWKTNATLPFSYAMAPLSPRNSTRADMLGFSVQAHIGQYPSVLSNGNFSYVRSYGAGHEYGTLATSQAAAQMFTQIMSDQSLFSTYISTFRRQIANSGVYCGSSLTAHAYECRIRASHRQSHMYSSNWGSDHPVLLRRNPGIVMCLNEMVALSAGYAQVTTWETCCRHCPCRRWDTGDGGSHS